MTDTTPNDLRSLVRALLEEHRTDATSLSRHIGRSKDYIRDYLEGRKTTLPLESQIKIEKALDLPPGTLVSADFRAATSERLYKKVSDEWKGVLHRAASLKQYTRNEGDISAESVPVFSFHDKYDGSMLVDKHIVHTIPRPHILASAPNAYGIIVEGEVMSPAYDPGDIALINPDISLRINADAVLFTSHDESGAAAEDGQVCMIRRITGYDDAEWRVKQLFPHQESLVSRAEWPNLSRVVGRFARS